MKRTFGFLLFFLIAAERADAQDLYVYPGDVNNNGVVNNLDFLYLGLAYNFIGPDREPSSGNGLEFAPQAATPWSFSFPNGTNYAHADCNGDGLVNYFYDAFPFYANYGLQRDTGVTFDVFLPGVQGVDVPLRFDPAAVPTSVIGGQVVSLPIELGTANHPANDVHGLAFSLHVDPELIDADQVQVNLSETSWANPDDDRAYFYKKVSPTRVDVGWTRTDHNHRDGYGRIGYVDFVIIVDVIDLQHQVPVTIDSIWMVDKFGNFQTVAGDTIWLSADSAASGTQSPLVAGPQVAIQPNPASDFLHVAASEPIREVLLTDLLGQVVWRQTESALPFSADLRCGSLPPGVYHVQVRTTGGVATRPVIFR